MIKRKKNDNGNTSSRRADDADKQMFHSEDPESFANGAKQKRETEKGSRRAKKESDQVKRSFDKIIKKNF